MHFKDSPALSNRGHFEEELLLDRLWVLLGVVTLAGLELIAFILTPAWPAYELRPIAVPTNLVRQVEMADGSHKTIPFYNSWGMKDLERSFDRPPGIRFRTVFNGDSFLEGMFRLEPLSHVVERDWARAGLHDMEAINLGISATSPIQYYYRISSVVVKLHPDAMLLMFYPGNDFTSQTYSPDRSLPFVAERPEPSLLGGIAPHLTWQIVNRLGLSEIASGNTSAADEYDIMLDIMKKPRKDRAAPLAAYLRRYYLPNVSEAQIEEILSRNGGSFWARPSSAKTKRPSNWPAGFRPASSGSRPAPRRHRRQQPKQSARSIRQRSNPPCHGWSPPKSSPKRTTSSS